MSSNWSTAVARVPAGTSRACCMVACTGRCWCKHWNIYCRGVVSLLTSCFCVVVVLVFLLAVNYGPVLRQRPCHYGEARRTSSRYQRRTGEAQNSQQKRRQDCKTFLIDEVQIQIEARLVAGQPAHCLVAWHRCAGENSNHRPTRRELVPVRHTAHCTTLSISPATELEYVRHSN